MKDLSLHLFDLIENSVKAGASHLQIDLIMDKTILKIHLQDNGPGFPPHILHSAADPFTTTRTERPVGLGLSLMKEAARQTGGGLTVANRNDAGAEVRIDMVPAHIDARPLGALGSCIMTALSAWPKLDITVNCGEAGNLQEVLNCSLLRRELSETELNHPSIRRFIDENLNNGLQPLTDWYTDQQAKALTTTNREV